MIDYIVLDVYRWTLGDCTLNGVSKNHDELVLVRNGIKDPDERAYPVVRLVEGPYRSIRLVPDELIKTKKWVMFGGNFAWTSSSTLKGMVFQELGIDYDGGPIKIFDRVE